MKLGRYVMNETHSERWPMGFSRFIIYRYQPTQHQRRIERLAWCGTLVEAIVSSRLMLGEDFRFGEVTGILLIGAGLALLSLIGWAASRHNF